MLGTWINVGTVVAGTIAGRLLGERLKPEARSTVTSVLGCITLILGIQNAMKTPRALDAAPLATQLGFFLVVLLSLLFGALVGETLNIERWLHRMGQFAERRFGQSEGDFGKGFVVASLLFCVGPLTILGCFQDGLKGDYSLLATKAVLDGFAAMAFAAAFGWGVMLSAITVLVVQGGLTLSAGAIEPLMTDVMVIAMTATGGIMLMGLGFRLLDIKQIRVANLLPALILAPLFVAVCNLVRPGFFPTGN
jgi:uncharacterized membrane protein YqgA involved in biofilm formation